MALKVRFGRQAIADLSELQAYLAPRSPRGADRVRQRIVDVVNRLSDLPLVGHETQNPRIRTILVTAYPYRVFYAVDEVHLTILHIRHTARAPIEPDELDITPSDI